MFALGIPNRQYRRTTQVLGHESSEPIPYEVEKQEDGFYLFMFPECDEYDFREIVRLLKVNGITTIGADSQLTEKNIMKLANLINEFAPTTEEKNKPKYLGELENTLKVWKRKEYKDDKHRAEMYYEDIKSMVEIWKDELEESKDAGAYDQTNKMVSEDKIRNLIRKTIRQ